MCVGRSCCHHSTRHFTGYPPSWLFRWSQLQKKVAREYRNAGKDACHCDEKWEGPCWHECYANLTRTPPIPCQPSCGAEHYQLETIKRAKTVNPKLAAVFYLNTLYDFPFLELHGEFLKANADIASGRQWKACFLQER